MRASNSPQRPEHRQKSHHEPGVWKAIPKIVKVLVLLCVLVLILIPVAKQKRWFESSQPATQDVVGTGYTPDLQISEAQLHRPTRTIRGTVKNDSNKVYLDVTVSFFVRDVNSAEAGEVLAKVGRLDPHATAPFETQALSPKGTQFFLREVTGQEQATNPPK
jgi:hypothetical protein